MNTQPEPRRAKRRTPVPPTASEVNKSRYAELKAAGKIKPKTQAAKEWRPHTPEQIEKLRIRQNKYNEKKRAKKLAAIEAGIIKDKRTKEGREKPHWKAAIAKPKPKPVLAKPQKPAPAPQPRKKLKQQAERIRITAIPISERVPLKIPEINATVYLRNGETAAACRERYLNRAGNKISKW